MAYEKECDIALKFMGGGRRFFDGTRYEDVDLGLEPPKLTGLSMAEQDEYQTKVREQSIIKHAVFAILRAEGLIEYGSKELMDFTKYFLTDKGKAFLASDSFVQRAERWDLESQAKKRSLRIME